MYQVRDFDDALAAIQTVHEDRVQELHDEIGSLREDNSDLSRTIDDLEYKLDEMQTDLWAAKSSE